MGRLLSNKLTSFLGQPVVIDYRPGAAGAIGNRNVSQSPPDGYSILFGVGSDMVIAQILGKDAPVDPMNDLTPISAAVAPISCIAVSSSCWLRGRREAISSMNSTPRFARWIAPDSTLRCAGVPSPLFNPKEK